MNKASRLIKRYIALILVLLFSIESFAAVVGDNDGAAFITKAEFDSLKNDFQSQLDRYNSSIDNKIDGAIASYLAGLSLAHDETLNNLYKGLGGADIKFGSPDISPTIKPIAGYAIFFENGDRYGVSTRRWGANHNGIKDPTSSQWVDKGDGVWGQYCLYSENGGKKYLSFYKRGMLQACYSGAWWTGSTVVRSAWVNYPWGDGARDVNVALQPVSFQYNDSFLSMYRVAETNSIDLSQWTGAWDVATNANKMFISEDNYKKANADLVNLGMPAALDVNYYNATSPVTSDGSIHDDSDFTVQHLQYYNWTVDANKPWDYVQPGIYYRRDLTNSLYGGVHMCQTTGQGQVNCKGVTFALTSGGSATTGDIYFAINKGEFSNTADFFGNVKLEDMSSGSELTPSAGIGYKYKVASGTKITFKFDCEKDKIYYIKCQSARTKTASNNSYVSISAWDDLLATYE